MKTGETKRLGVYEVACHKVDAKRTIVLTDTGETIDGSGIVHGLAESRSRLSVVTGELLKRAGVPVAFEERSAGRSTSIICSKWDEAVQAEIVVTAQDATSRFPIVEIKVPDGVVFPVETVTALNDLALQAFDVLRMSIVGLTVMKAPQGVWLAHATFSMGYDPAQGCVITSMMNLDTMEVRLKGAKQGIYTDGDALGRALRQMQVMSYRPKAA